MPPRFQPAQPTSQRPLQNEILTLHKLLGTDILEQAARILDHFAVTKENKFESTSFQTLPHLNNKLLEKCEDFETVCDQIYFILEQSKRVLQLEYQQKMIQVKAEKLEQEKQQLEKSEQQQNMDAMNVDTDMDFETAQMDVSMSLDDTMDKDPNNQLTKENTATFDEEDMEELLQIQRDRLDRLKNVIVLGMDADTVKASGRGGAKEDLLF